MKCFRATELNYCNPVDLLSGAGARTGGGRWNKPGQAVAYLAESPDVALVEKGYYVYTARLALAKAQVRTDRNVFRAFLEYVKAISLGVATLDVPDSLEFLDLTDEDAWKDITKSAGLSHALQDSRKSPYDSLPGHWTQQLSTYIEHKTNAVGLKALSARHLDGTAVILFSEKVKKTLITHESTESVVISPAGLSSVSALLKADPYQMPVIFRRDARTLPIEEFPI